MAYLVDRWKDPERKGRGKRWAVKWRVGTFERSESFTRKDDAVAFQLEVERSTRFGQFTDPLRGRVTVGEFASKWYATRAPLLKPTTAQDYDSLLRTQVLPRWGSTPLIGVEFVDVAEWISEMVAKGLSPSRIRQAHGVLCGILDLAVSDKRLQAHSIRKVPLPRLPGKRRHRYLSHRELQELADECGVYRPLILTLGYVGLRWGEAVALTPFDVKDGRIHVERSITERGGQMIVGTPKDHEHREIPVPAIVLDALEPLLDRSATEAIFTSPKGEQIRLSNFRGRIGENGKRWGVFLPALERAGLARMKIHELRHTAASLAVSSGANVLAVARMLGHADPSVTLRVYADLFDSDLEDVAVRVDEAARRARSERMPAGVIPLR